MTFYNQIILNITVRYFPDSRPCCHCLGASNYPARGNKRWILILKLMKL